MKENNNENELRRLIVIGGSAGSFPALTELMSKLPPTGDVAVCVVMHLSTTSSSDIIRQHLEKFTTYNCHVATDNDPIVAGNVYIASPDYHLLVQKGRLRLTKGPHENRYRPSIDVLFRSAAAHYNSRVIGIILSGMLDDGTSGMSAIKRCGGICVVQEPFDAAYPDMPISVLNNVDVDHRVPITDMGYVLDEIASRPITVETLIPDDVKLEAEVTERMLTNLDDMPILGEHSNFTCPDCGGGLWLMKHDDLPRYRCHTGHVYSERALLEKQNESLEESVWVAIRMLEERRNMLLTIVDRNNNTGHNNLERAEVARAADLQKHISLLKELLISLSKTKFPKDEGYL